MFRYVHSYRDTQSTNTLNYNVILKQGIGMIILKFYPDCEPVSIWGLIRHGKRYPGTEFGKHMKDAVVIKDYVVSSYENGNCSLCAQDVENLRNWDDDKELFKQPFQLTNEGYQELEGIGRRLKQAFPKLLEKLDKKDYVIRHAHGTWMAESAKGFVKGLNDKQLTIEPYKTDFNILAVSFFLY